MVSRVVDKNCGITSCAKVWKRKIDFDPRCSTFDPRFPSKGTNIKRDLTRHHKRIRDTNDKFHPFCDGGKAIQTLLGWKNQFYFYFHKSHLLLYLFVAVFVGKYFQFWQKRLLGLLTPPSASLQNHHHHDSFDIDMSRPVLEVVLRVGMIWNLGNWL